MMNWFPLIPVPNWLMLILNIVLWPIFHLGISKITLKTPDIKFKKDSWLYRQRKYEANGDFYEKILKIRWWKKWIPDGATIFNEGFKKKHLQGTQKLYIQNFIEETRRAEYSHILQIFPCVTFFIFNEFSIAMIMVIYALAFNLPLIWLQRYNRFRFQRLLKKL
ncbi:MAG: glycosyl-4,4'-diaponeurosporenoate acyltransferase [Firmicutes bacterium]|nr:glycosyl-4,4'-diaponeurosporenoate acyltransferase [Bacillota bacterium]